LYNTIIAWKKEAIKKQINDSILEREKAASNFRQSEECKEGIDEKEENSRQFYSSMMAMGQKASEEQTKNSDFQQRLQAKESNYITIFEVKDNPNERRKSIHNEEDVVEYVSPYRITNSTGYPIEIEQVSFKDNPKNKKQKYHLKNGKTMNFQIETDMESMFSKESRVTKDNKNIKIKLVYPLANVRPIECMDLDRVRTKKFKLSGDHPEIRNYNIIANIQLHGTGRIINISSEVCFENKTSKNLQVYVVRYTNKLNLL
jgi:hypothetical protein